MLPNFLLIGPGRAGSSWVYRNLRLHPEVFIPKNKSTMYFSENFSKGEEWYKSNFKNSHKKAIGEASVGYIGHKDAPQRIYNMLPDVKLIAVLRQPIERAYSSFNRQQALSKPGSMNATISFEEKLKASPHFISDGMNAENINRYFKYFPKENIKLFLFDDLQADNQKFLEEVFLFLGVDKNFISPILNKKVGSSEILKSNASAKPLYYAYRALLKFGLYDSAQYIYKNIKRDKIPLDKDLRNRLTQQYYASDIDEFEQIIGRDLSSWKG